MFPYDRWGKVATIDVTHFWAPLFIWAGKQKRLILQKGVRLSRIQISDAVKVGVANPQKVKLLNVSYVPQRGQGNPGVEK